MFFIIDKPRLQRLIAITRDDRGARRQDKKGPYYRIEANDNRLTLTGREVEAMVPATVYEPGVLFLRITTFRRMLQTITDTKNLAIQVNAEGLFFDNIRLSLDVGDMLLYADPAKAPARHPAECMDQDDSENDDGPSGRSLFDLL